MDLSNSFFDEGRDWMDLLVHPIPIPLIPYLRGFLVSLPLTEMAPLPQIWILPALPPPRALLMLRKVAERWEWARWVLISSRFIWTSWDLGRPSPVRPETNMVRWGCFCLKVPMIWKALEVLRRRTEGANELSDFIVLVFWLVLLFDCLMF